MLGLHVHVLMRLMRAGLPPAIFGSMPCVVQRADSFLEEFDFIELFCGPAMLSERILDRGWRGLSLDVKRDPVMQN